jgi:hypothetical protein
VWTRQTVFQYEVSVETLINGKISGREATSVRERVYCRTDGFKRPMRAVFRCELKHEVTQDLMPTGAYYTFNLNKLFFFMTPRTLLPRRRRKPHEVTEIRGYDRKYRGMFRVVTTLTPALRQRLSSTFNAGLG